MAGSWMKYRLNATLFRVIISLQMLVITALGWMVFNQKYTDIPTVHTASEAWAVQQGNSQQTATGYVWEPTESVMDSQISADTVVDQAASNDELQAEVRDNQLAVGEVLPSEEQLEAWNRSREVIKLAISRGIWEEADFLRLNETVENLDEQHRLKLLNMIGDAVNRQELRITNPLFIPAL